AAKRIRSATLAMPDARSSAVASAKTRSCSSSASRSRRTGNSMTFEPDVRTSGFGSGSASGDSSLMLCSIAQRLPLRPLGGELEASSRGVREWMIEDVQRSLVLVEDELEVIVVRGVGDGDRHQIRRSSPQQPDHDSVALAGHQFRSPRFVYRFEHLVLLR